MASFITIFGNEPWGAMTADVLPSGKGPYSRNLACLILNSILVARRLIGTLLIPFVFG